MEEEQNLALINKMKKGNKKGVEKGQKWKKEDPGSFNHGNKDLSHIKFFKCQKFEHFASQCHEKKGKGKQQQHRKQFARSVEASTRVDELSSKLETHFSMVSCLSSNTMFDVD
jgi:hypothetical protein